VQCIAVGSTEGLTDAATAVAAVGRKDGSLEIMNPNTGAILWRVDPTSSNPAEAAIEAVQVAFSGPAATAGGGATPVVISCTAGGAARLHANAKVLASFKVPAGVACSALDTATGVLAVGAQGAELRLYDLSQAPGPSKNGELAKLEPLFAAKGAKPNRIGLVDKPWTSAVAFFPDSGAKKVWTGTGHYKLRLYDINTSKRPVTEVTWGAARITALAAEPNGDRVWAANAAGGIEMYDVRAGRFSGAIRGAVGSVRALAMHPDGMAMASGGLDRFLRVHDPKSRAGMGKVYLKTQITGVAWCPADASMAPPPTAATAEGGEQEDQRRAQKREGGGRDGEKAAAAEGGKKKKKPRSAA
jgi:ribosome biogenesis protein NSA1